MDYRLAIGIWRMPAVAETEHSDKMSAELAISDGVDRKGELIVRR